ncbi:hypothetical protein EQG49_02470 [Periweissella cryptocerci]|uniref:Uncharacterized protein n=1 Tax=Periweissella cryptocerci TaxID=2506420 RepID=A0A4P6YRW7_9LACO|nr:putative HNHc nuclease [Periweissella cryptocerci]QBO35407.1 hypothetical protein EQG49_02470 [Periweissella cryptocerci]
MQGYSAKLDKFNSKQVLLNGFDSAEFAHDLALWNVRHNEVMLLVDDRRGHTPEQHRKIFAIVGDFAKWSGEDLETERFFLTIDFLQESGIEPFSLSYKSEEQASVTVAKQFINWLLDRAIAWNVPLHERPSELTDDIYSAMLMGLKHRSCVICGEHADIHHVDVVGLTGRDNTDHRRNRLMALCRTHHSEIEQIGFEKFDSLHHVEGIKLQEDLLIATGVMTRTQMNEFDAKYYRESLRKNIGD